MWLYVYSLYDKIKTPTTEKKRLQQLPVWFIAPDLFIKIYKITKIKMNEWFILNIQMNSTILAIQNRKKNITMNRLHDVHDVHDIEMNKYDYFWVQ